MQTNIIQRCLNFAPSIGPACRLGITYDRMWLSLHVPFAWLQGVTSDMSICLRSRFVSSGQLVKKEKQQPYKIYLAWLCDDW